MSVPTARTVVEPAATLRWSLPASGPFPIAADGGAEIMINRAASAGRGLVRSRPAGCVVSASFLATWWRYMQRLR